MQKTVYIMQGASGSGKSTVAGRIAAGYASSGLLAKVCSTDDFFVKMSGYAFNPKRLGEAHAWNQDRFRNDLAKGDCDVLIVDNTNIKAWEARPYVEAAVAAGASIVFVRCTGRFANVHGVPPTVVERQLAGMQELSIAACLAAERT
jgi:predicted kinase